MVTEVVRLPSSVNDWVVTLGACARVLGVLFTPCMS